MAEIAPIPGKAGWVPYLPPSRTGRWPWTHGKSWFWGLVALCVVAATSVAWAIPKIENRLDKQTKVRMTNADIDWSTLNLRWDYRDLTVSGELPPGVNAEQFATVVREGDASRSTLFATGIRQLSLNLNQADPAISQMIAKDQVLKVSVEAGDGQTNLNGVVETRSQRELLVNALLTSGVEQINDNLEVLAVNEATAGSDAKVGALASILELTGPQHAAFADVSLDESDLNYRIVAKDKESANAIENAATVAVLDFRVTGEMEYLKDGEVDVVARSDGSQLTLRGTVLSDEQQRRLLFAASEAIGSENIVNEVAVSDKEARIAGADNRVSGLVALLSQFKPDVIGEIQLQDSSLTINASVADESRQARLQKLASAAESDNFKVTQNITLRADKVIDDLTTLQTKLDSLADEIRATVVFDSGTAKLSKKAKATLDKVVTRIARYPQLRVEVEGHTDSVGREKVNDRISQSRAQAVKDYLTSQSIPENQLIAVGYGNRHPVESNDTAEGRQRNRRVHFKVIDQSTEKQEG